MTNELILRAPVSGVVYLLERVPDPVFAQKLMGDGLSIDPVDGTLRAPCAGEVVTLHPAWHALTLRTAGGVEVLMHIGIDTCLLYTSDAADERSSVDLGGRRIIKKKKR